MGCVSASAKRQTFALFFVAFLYQDFIFFVNMNLEQSQLEERSNSFIQENVRVGGAQRLTARNLLQ